MVALAAEKDKDRLIEEGMSYIKRNASHQFAAKPPFQKVNSFLERHNLVALKCDKESGFAILPSGIFQEKIVAAVQKNFRKVQFNVKRYRWATINLLELWLETLRKAVDKTKMAV